MSPAQFISQIRDIQEPLRRFLCVLCSGDSALADDIAQDAFMKAFLAVDSFREDSSLLTWIFRIGYNCFVDKMRKEGKSVMESITPEYHDVPSDVAADDFFKYEALYSAIDALSDNEKAALLLFYKEDMPVKDIAIITGLSESNVKVTLSRGRKHLKDKLENGNR